MRKIINSATTQYEPVLTEELVLDDRPISGSFNGITSDAVYNAISVDPGNVPPVESTDNGKVLTASYGEGGGSFAWATPEAPQGELPAYTTSDADKVLGVVVDSSGDTPVASLDWVDQPANELPEQLGTAGQVLTVNAGATGVEWATPSGGGSSNVETSDLPQSSDSGADILAAYNAAVAAHTANKAIIGKITGSQGKYKYIVCTKVSYGGGNYTFDFSGTMEDFPGSTPSVPLYVWAQLACAPRESYYSMQYKCAPLGVTLQNWNPWYIPPIDYSINPFNTKGIQSQLGALLA